MATRDATFLPTLEQVRSALDYDPDTGIFTWRYRPDMHKRWNSRLAGKTAGCHRRSAEYHVISVNNCLMRAHRLAWLLSYGEWPSGFIDHINSNKLDNRLSNLRISTNAQNMRNRGRTRTNQSGYKGVGPLPECPNNPWRAQITVNGQTRYLGSYKTPEQAHEAYCKAAIRLHGEFAKFG